MKILVVEDELPLQQAIKRRFLTEGYEVITANNGQEGLDVALKEHPNLILLDIIMPIMDGMSMLTELRKDTWGKDVKVFFLSNLTDPGNSVGTLSLKIRGFLVKSDWMLSDIVDLVAKEISAKPN